ncbi:ureidoglycolate dehydrogenase [Anaerobacillus isosaccharinicus]|uniref:Ureidoglycolate dehydrogenase n=1 Tax=Anaerobacillus isosaccharinicus TaxID=1532552 RepID=A0A1S2LHV8_9BACI|nr:ureidoglycolate dehydrogenase [Anaerobacillus isosaccharinicus]MBA5588362.1 ureidoglycolate dehydrogenase [Anaerobacillus isosaccharinicus]QOY38204.1 ureidoglycolate dehydrogenase [Anaerobacillus isosaccharinicus]
MDNILVKSEELKSLVVKKLTQAGLNEGHAHVVADVLVHADLRGVSSHGVLRTEHYVKRLLEGGVNPNAKFSMKETGPCTAVFDGDDGMGHVVLKEAMEHAITMAEKNGIGMMTAINSSHCGALSYFAQQAASKNMIGVAMTHTDSIVVPFGGAKPFLGTNPIAYGFPAKRNKPVILDMATSNVALGKILHARESGTAIPAEWGVDENGIGTTDPHNVKALSPFAGPKGYGLGLVVEIFSGLLAGAAFGPHITKMYGDYNKSRKLGHYLCAIDPTVFTDKNDFLENMDRMIDEIHELEPAKGFRNVMVPGEPEQLKEEMALKTGVPITENVYQYLVSK